MNSVVTAYPDALPEATSTSLSLPETLTFEQWEEIGAELANRARKLNWWIGDWWAAGHHRYGERARLAARGLFGKEFKTLANIASVCRAFEPSRRREHLSWSHHAEAAALSAPAADMLLDLAERDRLSKAQVRAAVTTIRGGPVPRTISLDEAAVAGLFRAYNRLPGEVRGLVAQAFAVVATTGAEIDPATGSPRIEAPAEESEPTPEDMAAQAALDVEAIPEETEPEPASYLAAETEVAPVEVEAAFGVADWDTPALEAEAPLDPAVSPAEPNTEATLDLAEWDFVPAEDKREVEAAPEPLDLAPNMEALPPAAESYIEYDLTLDMAALQAEAAPRAPLDLASEMEVASAERDAALDLDLEMAMPVEAEPDAALDLDSTMEEAQAPARQDRALTLGPEMEEHQQVDKDRKAASQTEPWLLP